MGLSERLLDDSHKGHLGSFDDYVHDTKIFVDSIVKEKTHDKFYALAHSTGGLILANYLLRYPNDFGKVVLNAPMFGIHTDLPRWLVTSLVSISALLGKKEKYVITGGPRNQNPEFLNNELTHDFDRWFLWEQYINGENPQVNLGSPTFNWLNESRKAWKKAIKKSKEIKVPLLLLQAQEDKVVLQEPQKRFIENLTRGKMEIIEGAWHEILMEEDSIREKALNYIRTFLSNSD
jgi:lysophospholipase